MKYGETTELPHILNTAAVFERERGVLQASVDVAEEEESSGRSEQVHCIKRSTNKTLQDLGFQGGRQKDWHLPSCQAARTGLCLKWKVLIQVDPFGLDS